VSFTVKGPLAAALLQLINHAIQIGIACAKASGEPVAAAFYNWLSISQHRKLAGFARCNYGINSEPFLNHGCETRSFGFVALSRRAGTYFYFHPFLQIVRDRFTDQRYQCKSAVRFAFRPDDARSPDVPI
jgi:hypothetical protein